MLNVPRTEDSNYTKTKTQPTLRAEVFTSSRNENSGQVLSSLSVKERVKRNVGAFSELFRNASPISEGNGLDFSISHEDEAKNRGFWHAPFVKPHRVEPYPSQTCPLLPSKFNTSLNCACSVNYCAGAMQFLSEKASKFLCQWKFHRANNKSSNLQIFGFCLRTG